MKRKLQFLGMILLSSFALKAQTVIMSENFEGGSFPATWTQTTLATDGGWLYGNNTSLSSQYWTVPAHTNFIATNDDDCNCDKSNDFLMSPVIDLSGQTAVGMKFDVFFYGATIAPDTETLKIEASNNGGTSWTVLQTVTGAGAWNTIMVDLSSYAGQANVKIGFRYSDNGGAGAWLYGAAIDDFQVYVPLATDMAALSVALPTFLANGSSLTVTGEMQNLGAAAVTGMTLNYSVDNGTPVTQVLTGLNIAPINGSYSFSHGTPWVAGPVGSRTIKVWATNINGNADLNTSNDEAQGTVIVASQVVNRVTCVEEFTSSTCAPCASLNATFDPLLEGNNANNVTAPGSDVSVIKYQMNWPSPGNDPSYNADGLTRRTYYGVTGIPSPWIDGGVMANADQSDIDNALLKPSPIAINCTYSVNGGFVGVTAVVTPYITVPSGSKLYIAVLEKQYDYAASTTSQDEFHHAMRKMLPNGSGITVNNLIDGTAQTFTQSYNFTTAAAGTVPAQNSYSLWVGPSNLEVVAFLQNDATGEIYQSAIGTKVAGIEDQTPVFGVNIYPNPANEQLMVSVNLKESSSVSVEILNTLGQVVFANSEGQLNGSKNLRINTSEIPAGVYFARVVVGESTQTMKFTVAH